MAQKIYDSPITKSVDWNGDSSTGNLPVSGKQVQAFIKNTLNNKVGLLHYDETNNRYLAFADNETRDKYLADTTKTDLILGTFDAPFNFSAEINLLSPNYKAVLLGTTGNYLDFTFDILNKTGQSTGEDVFCTIKFIKNGVTKTLNKQYVANTSVHINIDDYLEAGTNRISIGIIGKDSLAATTVSVTYQVINLQLTHYYNLSTPYNVNGHDVVKAAIPYTVSGYGTKTMEWYLDGVKLDYIKNEDEIVDTETSRTKYIDVSNLNFGKHSLQFRVYTTIDSNNFYSDIQYLDLIVDNGSSNNPIIACQAIIPIGNPLIGEGGNLAICGITQYVPYPLLFSVYSPSSLASLQADIALNGTKLSSIMTTNAQTYDYSIRVNEEGVKTLTITASTVVYTITLNVAHSNISLAPIVNNLVLDLSATGKTNNDLDRATWKYGNYETTFSKVKWNAVDGWHNNQLILTDGGSATINMAPYAADPAISGYTIEFELSTNNVSDDSAIICDMRNSLGTGILIKATEISLTSTGGTKVLRQFKSNESFRLSVVINPRVGSSNKCLAMLYINGICSAVIDYVATDTFTSDGIFKFVSSHDVSIALSQIRCYSSALTDDQILNNYNLYRPNIEDMLSIYDRNQIYEKNSTNLSLDALASQCPLLKITGNIPVLEATTDKNETIYVNLEYVNLQDPTKSFTSVGTRMRPQGTSSMSYPKKNYRIYTNYGTMYDYQGKQIAGGLYSFKDKAQPVSCWCFKADYAESSGTHNAGIAKLWNQVMYDAQINGEYKLRTNAQKAALDNHYNYDVRTTVDGFPCNLFYRLDENSEWIYIGKYNFNNDKSTEKVFGFKDIPGFDNTNMQCWEILNNGHHLALFSDMSNWDADWSNAFESRFPDGSKNTTNLKAFATWLSGVKDDSEAFSTGKWDHLDVYKVAAYYIYLMRFGAVDQVVKNAMFTSEDGVHWYFINYDNDTINGVRNDGILIYNWNINRQTLDTSYEAEVYAYAGHDSVLWNRLEADTEFMNIVSVVDNALYVAGLSYDKVIEMFDNNQSSKWSERIYNQDAQYKYIGPYTNDGVNNLFMLQGSRLSHRRWWLSHRFELLDALYVSGAYKSKSLEFKVANAPIGLTFDIIAGASMPYGYGVNNVVAESGVTLTKDTSHTFTTQMALNVGDPVRIYNATNLAGIDLSNFIEYISTITLTQVYNDVVGTKFKKLVLGVNTAVSNKRNSSLSLISGLSKATALEYLDISGFTGISSLDLSNQVSLQTLKAYESGLTNILLASGCLCSYLELPDTMQSISLIDMSNLSTGLLIANNGKNLNNIVIKNCVNFDSKTFVFNWLDNKVTSNALCSLIMTNINWSNVTTAQLLKLGQIKVDGGTLSLQGKIKVIDATAETLTQIKSIFGVNVFDEHNELYIEAPVGLYMVGPSSLLIGDSAQYNAYVFPSVEGTYNYHLENSSGQSGTTLSGVTIDANTGAVTSVEGITSQTPLTVVAAFVATQNGDVKIGKLNFNANPRVYPTSGSIVSNDGQLFDELGSHILNMTYVPSSFSGHISLNWSGSGDAYTNGNISLSNATGNQVTVNVLSIPSVQISGIITCQVLRKYDSHVIGTYNISLSVVRTGLIMTNVSNPQVMSVCYAQGWAANSSYMTKTEAALVTSIGTAFNGCLMTSFIELKYFTNVKTLGVNALQNCYKMQHIDLTNITCILSNAFYNCPVLVEIDAPNCTDLRYNSVTDTTVNGSIGQYFPPTLMRINLPAVKNNYWNNLFVGVYNDYANHNFTGIDARRNILTIDYVRMPATLPLLQNSNTYRFTVTDLLLHNTTENVGVSDCQIYYLTLPGNIDSIFASDFSTSHKIYIGLCYFTDTNVTSSKNLNFNIANTNATSISLPNLTSLENCSFNNNTALASVNFPMIDRWYPIFTNTLITSIHLNASQKLTIYGGYNASGIQSITVDANNPYYAQQSNGIITAKNNAHVYLFIPSTITSFVYDDNVSIPSDTSYVINGETYVTNSLEATKITDLTVTKSGDHTNVVKLMSMAELTHVTISSGCHILMQYLSKLTNIIGTIPEISFQCVQSGVYQGTLTVSGATTYHNYYATDYLFDYAQFATLICNDVQHIYSFGSMIYSPSQLKTINFPDLLDYRYLPTATFENTNMSYATSNSGMFDYGMLNGTVINMPKITSIILSDAMFYSSTPASYITFNAPLLTELLTQSTFVTSTPNTLGIDMSNITKLGLYNQDIILSSDTTLNFTNLITCKYLKMRAIKASGATGTPTLTINANACTTMQGVALSSNVANATSIALHATSCTSIDAFPSSNILQFFANAVLDMPSLIHLNPSTTNTRFIYKCTNLTLLTLTNLQTGQVTLDTTGVNCNIDLPAITGGLQFINCTGSISTLSAYQPSSISIAGLLNLKNLILHNLSAPLVVATSFGSSASDYTGYTNRAAGTNALIVPSNAAGFDTGYWLSPLCDANCGGFVLQKTL